MTPPRRRHRTVRALRASDPLSILMGIIAFAIMALVLKALGRL